MSSGAYILLMQIDRSMRIDIGKLGNLRFSPGYYAYVGSALGGLEKRIARHLRSNKKLHWHIDHLLVRARLIGAVYGFTKRRIECAIASYLKRRLAYTKNFGSSDCSCASHLFYSNDLDRLKNLALESFKSLGISPLFISSEGYNEGSN